MAGLKCMKKNLLSSDRPDYRDMECPNCGRCRVEIDGVCEKCGWDVDGGNYSSITRPESNIHPKGCGCISCYFEEKSTVIR